LKEEQFREIPLDTDPKPKLSSLASIMQELGILLQEFVKDNKKYLKEKNPHNVLEKYHPRFDLLEKQYKKQIRKETGFNLQIIRKYKLFKNLDTAISILKQLKMRTSHRKQIKIQLIDLQEQIA